MHGLSVLFVATDACELCDSAGIASETHITTVVKAAAFTADLVVSASG